MGSTRQQGHNMCRCRSSVIHGRSRPGGEVDLERCSRHLGRVSRCTSYEPTSPVQASVACPHRRQAACTQPVESRQAISYQTLSLPSHSRLETNAALRRFTPQPVCLGAYEPRTIHFLLQEEAASLSVRCHLIKPLSVHSLVRSACGQ